METYGLISTYTSGVVESMTLQIEDFIPPDHTRANYAGLVLHGAHRVMRKGKKVMIFGFLDHHRGLKSDQSHLAHG